MSQRPRRSRSSRQSGPVKQWLIDRIPSSLRPAARHWYRAALARYDPEMAMLRPLLEPGTTAIDVGAHVGVYAYFFTRHGLRVEAFEPLESSARALGGLRGLGVSLHRVALSDAKGWAALEVPLEGRVRATGRTRIARISETPQLGAVECRTLDSYGFSNISVIKIDAEGHEPAVLRGAAATVQREKPVLLLELERRHLGEAGWEATAELLTDLGYLGFFTIGAGRVFPLRDFQFDTHQRLIRGAPADPYVNNFVFVSRMTPHRLERACQAWGIQTS